jgi:DNA-binding NarL/FixJ family response regulator
LSPGEASHALRFIPPIPETPGLATLTRREQEVAALACRGLSNACIAERLVVSVRTVESHLYSAYGKLGVPDRAALAVVLGSQ